MAERPETKLRDVLTDAELERLYVEGKGQNHAEGLRRVHDAARESWQERRVAKTPARPAADGTPPPARRSTDHAPVGPRTVVQPAVQPVRPAVGQPAVHNAGAPVGQPRPAGQLYSPLDKDPPKV